MEGVAGPGSASERQRLGRAASAGSQLTTVGGETRAVEKGCLGPPAQSRKRGNLPPGLRLSRENALSHTASWSRKSNFLSVTNKWVFAFCPCSWEDGHPQILKSHEASEPASQGSSPGCDSLRGRPPNGLQGQGPRSQLYPDTPLHARSGPRGRRGAGCPPRRPV